MPREARFGVFEMGMNHAGELAALTRLVRPHVAIVTAIASAHREFFASEEAIADAKGEIFQGLEPGGTAIIPYDSPHRDRLVAAARPYAGEDPDLRPRRGRRHPRPRRRRRRRSGGTLVTAVLPEAELTFTVSPARRALGVERARRARRGRGAWAAISPRPASRSPTWPGLKGRGERHRIAVDGGEALLIDESYNANPASMAATLKMLRRRSRSPAGASPCSARCASSATSSDAFHAALAGPVEAAGVDYAILVGEEMEPLAKALGAKVKMAHVPDAAAAIELARARSGPGDAILVKGSNSIGLAALVEALAGGKS